ncbi:MAG: PHP domain-containing protein, partial [Chloroflexi bacterium]|nr:PHP domain-containing protein [Chloroflexota bacterium]
MPGADLHLHTTCSDGTLSPTDLVRRAAAAGLEVIAITDHDTVDGLAEAFEAACEFPGLQVIPGVELSTDIPRSEVHILGYFMDYQNPQWLAT